MTTSPLSTRARAGLAAALLPVVVALPVLAAGPALAAEAPALVPLTVTLSGPSLGTAGTTATWRVSVANAGTTSAGIIRVTLQLPNDIDVASVDRAPQWTCVLAPMSCQLADLPAGAAAPTLTLSLRYADRAVGHRQLSALAYQGENSGALSIQRGPADVVLAAAPEPSTSPAATPSSTSSATTQHAAAASTAQPTTPPPAARTAVRVAAPAMRSTATAAPRRSVITAATRPSVDAAQAGGASAAVAAAAQAVGPAASLSPTATTSAPAELAFADSAAASAPQPSPGDGPSPLLWASELLVLLLVVLAAGIVGHNRLARRQG